MADETKKILIDVELKSSTLKDQAVELNKELDSLIDKRKILTVTGQKSTKEFQDNEAAIRATKTQIRETNKEIDASVRAIKAQSDSLEQNRNLLISLNAEYVKLSQTEGKTAASTIKMKNDIAALTATIKVQEKEIGDHRREVGNYGLAFEKATDTMSLFGGQLSQAAQGLNAVKSGFMAAKAGTVALDVALAASGIGIFLVVLAALVSYLKDFDSIIDGVAQKFAGFSAAVTTFASSVVNFVTGTKSFADSFENLGGRMADAAREAANLKEAQQDLADAMQIQEVANKRAEQQIAQLMLQARNRTISDKERQKFLQQAAELDQKNYAEKTRLATADYNLAVNTAKNYGALTREELRRLAKEGTAYANELRNKDRLRDEHVDAIQQAELRRIDNLKESTQRQETIQNRADQSADRARQARERQQDISDRAKEKKDREDLEAKEARLNSLSKEAETLLDTYGKEVQATDNHYRTLILKYEKYSDTVAQLQKERLARLSEIAEDFRKKDQIRLDEIQKEITAIAISSMQNAADKEIATLQNTTSQKMIEMDKSDNLVRESIDKQQTQIRSLIGKGKDDEIAILKDAIAREMDILDKSGELREVFLRAQKVKEDEIKRGRDEKSATDTLAGDLIGAQMNQDFQTEFAIRQQQLDLEHDQQIAAAERAGQDTYLINQQYTQKTIALWDQKLTAEANIDKRRLGYIANFTKGLAGFMDKQSGIYKAASLVHKAAAIAEIIIDTRAAIIKTFKGYAGMPFIGKILAIAETAGLVALSASSINEIRQQKFAKGGQYVSDGKGAALPGYSRTDNMNAQLRDGEGIVVSEAMQAPWARNIVSAINVAFGGRDFSVGNTGKGFAIGGIYTDGGNSNRYYNQPMNNNEELANTIAYQIINNFPPIYTNVRDINTQQNILNKTVDRVIL